MRPALSAYEIAAGLFVARLMDAAGNGPTALESSMRHAATSGRFPAHTLMLAQSLLVEVGLLVAGSDGRLFGTPALSVLARLDEDAALELLGRLLEPAGLEVDHPMASADERARIGAMGEEHVVKQCAEELRELGFSDLSGQVQRVSLISDALGYDVEAPSIGGGSRMIEVKTMSIGQRPKLFRFFITRNEYEVGRRHARRWAVVGCFTTQGLVELVGWCRASDLHPYLPEDNNGRWTEAMLALPVNSLKPGLPSAVS